MPDPNDSSSTDSSTAATTSSDPTPATPPADTTPAQIPAPTPAPPTDDELLADFKSKKAAFVKASADKAAQDAVVAQAIADQITLRDAETAARKALDDAAEALIADIKAQE